MGLADVSLNRTVIYDLDNNGIESNATTLDEIIDETLSAVESERTTRVIDKDSGEGSMERRKKEGYF